MNQFDVTFGNNQTGLKYNVPEFDTYEHLIKGCKEWVSRDVNRYCLIKFSNKLTDAIRWRKINQPIELVVHHFNDVEAIAKSIREKK